MDALALADSFKNRICIFRPPAENAESLSIPFLPAANYLSTAVILYVMVHCAEILHIVNTPHAAGEFREVSFECSRFQPLIMAPQAQSGIWFNWTCLVLS